MTHPTEANKTRILVVDDEESARIGLAKLLTSEGFIVDLASDGADALNVANEHAPDVVITDLKMPTLDGVQLAQKLHEHRPDLPIIVTTAFGDVNNAVRAMRAGVDDYLTKPVDFDALLVTVHRTLERRSLMLEAENLRAQLRERDGEGLRGLVGSSAPMQKVYRTAKQVASSRATVLVTGESGTGKGELARAIHELGPRADKPFVSLNCTALADSLLESELFGHERGSFTGADKKRIGRFEQANGGTLFLDEVGEIPPLTQVKLLRVLQERTFERVGGNETITVDVRVIAATNRDLAADVREGRFREDLYYRLNVVNIEMPPLRVRGEDIMTLANHFLRRYARENHRSIDEFTDAARAKIKAYAWPGNVRELENGIERAVVLGEHDKVDASDLPFDGAVSNGNGVKVPGATMAELERHAIIATLAACGGSTTKAAEMLDISVRTIQYRLHEYGLAKKPTDGAGPSSSAPTDSLPMR